jgi:hypothetical protein
MRKMVLAGVILTLALGVGPLAQAPAGAAQQRPAQVPVGPRFADANGDGICDNLAAGGAFGRGMGGGVGRGMRGGFGVGMRGGFGGGFAFGQTGASLIDVVARVTGQDRSVVLGALQNGKSLAQIGEASGKSAQDLVEAVMAERKNAVWQAVSNGRLTQQQADQMMAWMKTRIELNVAGTWQLRGGGVTGPCIWGSGTAVPPATR